MKENIYRIAALKRWAKVSKKKRFERMSIVAKAKQAQLTPQQKRKHALKMVKAREQKKTNE